MAIELQYSWLMTLVLFTLTQCIGFCFTSLISNPLFFKGSQFSSFIFRVGHSSSSVSTMFAALLYSKRIVSCRCQSRDGSGCHLDYRRIVRRIPEDHAKSRTEKGRSLHWGRNHSRGLSGIRCYNLQISIPWPTKRPKRLLPPVRILFLIFYPSDFLNQVETCRSFI